MSIDDYNDLRKELSNSLKSGDFNVSRQLYETLSREERRSVRMIYESINHVIYDDRDGFMDTYKSLLRLGVAALGKYACRAGVYEYVVGTPNGYQVYLCTLPEDL